MVIEIDIETERLLSVISPKVPTAMKDVFT